MHPGELAKVRVGGGHAGGDDWRASRARTAGHVQAVAAADADVSYAGLDLSDGGGPFVDALDEIVFEAALARFVAELGEAGVVVG